MTPERIKELRELLSKATPEPWFWSFVGATPGEGCLRLDSRHAGNNVLITDRTDKSFEYDPTPSQDDATLIVALRNEAAAMLDEIENLTGQVARARGR